MQATQLTVMARIVLAAVAVTMGTCMAARAEDSPAKAAPQEPKADAPAPTPSKPPADAKPAEPTPETKGGKPPFAVVLKDATKALAGATALFQALGRVLGVVLLVH